MGNIGNKYRVHEVAKDFGLPTKQITEILTQYAQTPKNHMQVLEDRELSLIFEYLTQHNPVSGIQVIFAEGMKPAEKKAESAPEKKAEPKKEQGKAPASKAEPAQKKPEAKPVQQSGQPMSRVPKTKVVDTSRPRARRSSATANSAGTTTLSATSASRRRQTVCAACGWRLLKRPPLPCRSPTRSAWASWPAG